MVSPDFRRRRYLPISDRISQGHCTEGNNMTWIDDMKVHPSAARALAGLTPVSDAALRAIASEHSGIPGPYLQFLREVGYGTIGREYFMLYSGVVDPIQIWGEAPSPSHGSLWLFGDDYCGICVAFSESRSWSVVEIGPSVNNIEYLEKGFQQYIAELLQEIARTTTDR
jgi:hypothetical protein